MNDKEKAKEVKGFIAVDEIAKSNYYNSKEYLNSITTLNQAMKGQTSDIPVKFPSDLGAQHPFDFKEVQGAYEKVGLVSAAANRITDSVLGDFQVKVDDDNAQALLTDFINDSNFLVSLRPWILEAVLKGNGFMELDLPESKVRVMNANNMYVRRTKKGKVIEFTQFTKPLSSFTKNKDATIQFKPDQMAHLAINKIPNDPYGIGFIYPNMITVDNYAGAESDLHKLISRKAGAPYHVQIGAEGESVQPGDIQEFSDKLKFQSTRTEWVTDGNVKITSLDFKDVGKNLTDAVDHDVEQFSIGTLIPLVILGKANIPEGLAKVQLEAYQRFIHSIRLLVEEVVEQKILRPYLRQNGMDMSVDFIWELPGEEEKNERLRVIGETLKNPFISPVLKASLEIEYAKMMGFEDAIRVLTPPEKAEEVEQARMDREREETEIKQPAVPGAKPTANQTAQNNIKETKKPDLLVKSTAQKTLTLDEARQMSVAEYVNITEIAGFNYTDYLVKILQNLKTFKFEELRAVTEQDLVIGLLPKSDIEKLRIVLKDGFRKNLTIREIEKDIANSINLKDRIKIQEDGTARVTLGADARPLVIARTETIRLANAGLKDLYLENQVNNYRYLAALDDRTSEICNSLNGQVFATKDGEPGVNMPPMHANCRSTIVGLVD